MHSEIASQEANQLSTWICIVCDWVYDEQAGSPVVGFPPGLCWEDVRQDWSCLNCGVSKREFEMVPL